MEGPYNTIPSHYCERLSDCVKSNRITVTTPRTLQHAASKDIKRNIQEVSRHFFVLIGCFGAKVAAMTLKVIRFAGFIFERSGNAGHNRRTPLP
jgi:hypothetical protein